MNKIEKTVEMFLNELKALGRIKQMIAKREEYLRKIVDQLQSQESKESVDAETIVSELTAILSGSGSSNVDGAGASEILSLSWYPMSAKKQDKIKAILRNQGRVMRSPDVEKLIEKYEGIDRSAETLKSFWFTITQMVKHGELVSCMVNNSKKHNFFALPEWLEGKTLPVQYYPQDKDWGNLPDKERTFKNQKWKGGER